MAAKTARVRDAANTRADLLAAAQKLFTVNGYERTTSRDIAARAGANVSLINRYFGSKEGLFEAVVHQAAHTLAQFPDETLDGFITRYTQALTSGSWPDHGGQHPLLLLLRGMGADARTVQIRRRVLRSLLRSLGDLMPENGIERHERQLRADILLALFAGVLLLRDALPASALSEADPLAVQAVLGIAATGIASGWPHPRAIG